jgi:hypothetical protein
VSPANPFLLALNTEVVFKVDGGRLSAGGHRLVISFTAELVGKVEFDVTDTLS